ncbi:hypothetical protein HanRHA438_Chr03g0101631 [Helianthus annuus]|uniref:Uncharacterized protein n=1 Tax=Helianthus annuus TaxID=4232 RepID=A0A251TEK7_HELAN|nr:hypothetical protein HanXRQr2_Chr03g0090311 [Helianthus annuus]KAJ0606590.1 hypothetical protein HanHA89_Chr03g0086851 [Helianthus annuus]KAJ0933925.1 hypothetical protein HanRHA438_Chr03g0101631 [Helianthus annuus]
MVICHCTSISSTLYKHLKHKCVESTFSTQSELCWAAKIFVQNLNRHSFPFPHTSCHFIFLHSNFEFHFLIPRNSLSSYLLSFQLQRERENEMLERGRESERISGFHSDDGGSRGFCNHEFNR